MPGPPGPRSPAKFAWAGGAANQYEFLSMWGSNGSVLFPQTTDLDTNLFGNSSTQSFYYRCVTYP